MKQHTGNKIVKFQIIAKCILCGKKEVLTGTQISDAKLTGAAISTCCSFPMTVEKAKLKS